MPFQIIRNDITKVKADIIVKMRGKLFHIYRKPYISAAGHRNNLIFAVAEYIDIHVIISGGYKIAVTAFLQQCPCLFSVRFSDK